MRRCILREIQTEGLITSPREGVHCLVSYQFLYNSKHQSDSLIECNDRQVVFNNINKDRREISGIDVQEILLGKFVVFFTVVNPHQKNI